MRIIALPIFLASFVASAVADGECSGPNARTQPPAGATIVDASGVQSGSFRTISEAVAHLPDTKNELTLFIFPGVYQEQVSIPKLSGKLVLQGYTCNTMSYDANQVTITQAKAQSDFQESSSESINELTATLLLTAKNVKVYNLNIANTAGHISQNGQAVAVALKGSTYGFYACNITGYQDTLMADSGRELFARTLISGAVDFIFGFTASLWCQSCDIKTVGAGCITANGRRDASSASGYVFNKARVFGPSGKGSSCLGRPWRKYASVVWQNSKLGDVISPDGWQRWNNDPDTEHVFFMEFNNTGTGAATNQRVPFSGQLTAPIPITQILGDNYDQEWFVDTKYL